MPSVCKSDAHELVWPVVWQVAEKNAVDDGANADGGAEPMPRVAITPPANAGARRMRRNA